MITHRTEDGEITIHHNGDWSGEVEISVAAPNTDEYRRVTIPGTRVLCGDYDPPVDCPVTERELRRATALAVYVRATHPRPGAVRLPGVRR
jgi:hypothetical protein